MLRGPLNFVEEAPVRMHEEVSAGGCASAAHLS